MKLDSHWFEKVRIPPRRTRPEVREEAVRVQGCEHPGCSEPGKFRAPKGRDLEGQYFHFCVDHVRQYNASYDYFRGMSPDALAEYQKSAATGHRPTWTVGTNGAHKPGEEAGRAEAFRNAAYEDPFDIFAGSGRRKAQSSKEASEARQLKNVERQSLEKLDLDMNATAVQIRARYKELVKRLHPDANGGDRGSEGKLREIIQAYKYLRQAGLA
jgi:hypothetical protein